MSQHADLDLLKEKASGLVDLAVKKGAVTAMADLYQKTDFSVEVRNSEIENLSEAESFGVYLTVSKDHRRAAVSTSDLSPASFEELTDQAMALCRYTDQDSYYSLPEKDLLAWESRNLDLFDPKVLTVSTEEKIQRARELEDCLRAQDSRLKPDGCSLNTVVASSALANSLGFCQAETGGMIGMSASAFVDDQVQEGDLNVGRKQIGHWSVRTRHLEDMVAPEEIASLAARQVLRKLGAHKPKTGKFPVYFEPKMARTLWTHLTKAMTGSSIFRNESWLVDRIDSQICNPCITLVDDPHLPRGLRSKVFDDEGVACQRRELVKDGVLTSYMMNTYSSNKLNRQGTGHAGGAANLIVQPGTMSEEDMVRNMDTGVWVISLLGSGVNASTGDYSRGALGLWVENGKPQYPIIEFTLAGNLKNMFRDIVMLGDNVYTKDSIQTPGLVIGEMTVSGS